jgi:lysophospholipase L1-like esterase
MQISMDSASRIASGALEQKTLVPPKVIVLGDSLVYGYGDAECGGWVERLRRQWLNPGTFGPILYNLGVRGDTVKHIAQRLESEVRCRGELRHRIPDGLILSFGVNDSARLGHVEGRHMVPFAEFQLTLAELLDRAIDLCPICFIGMIPVNPARMPFMDAFYFTHEDQYLYKEATRLACQERSIPYLDTFEIWRQRGSAWSQSLLCRDGLHLNTEGHQALLSDILAWHQIQQMVQPSMPESLLSNRNSSSSMQMKI